MLLWLARPRFGVTVIANSLSGGEWITAYQAEQRRHLKAVMKSTKPGGQRSKMIYPPTNTREASSFLRPSLNGLFLMLNCFVKSPGDLCVANISGKDLKDVSKLLADKANILVTDYCVFDVKTTYLVFGHVLIRVYVM